MNFLKFVTASSLIWVAIPASAGLLNEWFSTTIDERATLAYGTVKSMEPVVMEQIKERAAIDHGGTTLGAALTGGSVTGIIAGAAVGVFIDRAIWKNTKEISGNLLTIELDSGEELKLLKKKGDETAYRYGVNQRVSVIAYPERKSHDSPNARMYPAETIIEATSVTKEEAPAMIAKRAPHQVTGNVKPAAETTEVPTSDN